MKQNTMLMIGGAIVVYLLWKKSQETTETVIVEGEAMSRASGESRSGGKCTNWRHVICNRININGECTYGCSDPSICSGCTLGSTGNSTTVGAVAGGRRRRRRR